MLPTRDQTDPVWQPIVPVCPKHLAQVRKRDDLLSNRSTFGDESGRRAAKHDVFGSKSSRFVSERLRILARNRHEVVLRK